MSAGANPEKPESFFMRSMSFVVAATITFVVASLMMAGITMVLMAATGKDLVRAFPTLLPALVALCFAAGSFAVSRFGSTSKSRWPCMLACIGFWSIFAASRPRDSILIYEVILLFPVACLASFFCADLGETLRRKEVRGRGLKILSVPSTKKGPRA